MKLKYLLVLSLLCACCMGAQAQSMGVKTSATLWATLTPNVELSYVVTEHITAHLPVQYNPFVLGENSRFQQLTVMPGARYWFKLAHARYFVSGYAIASRFHVGGWFDQPYRYDGKCFGLGIGGGYSWLLSKCFNLEAELGFGGAYANYDKCYWPKNSKRISNEKGIRFFPSKFDVSLVYFF
ncbi:MAG: DUF3575 domain-containing protein [Parabacteroides sp.]